MPWPCARRHGARASWRSRQRPHSCRRPSSPGSLQYRAYQVGCQHRHVRPRDGDHALTLVHQRHRCRCRHDLKPPISLHDLQRLARRKPKSITQRLGDDDAPRSVNGSPHARNLPSAALEDFLHSHLDHTPAAPLGLDLPSKAPPAADSWRSADTGWAFSVLVPLIFSSHGWTDLRHRSPRRRERAPNDQPDADHQRGQNSDRSL
ncbi:hypothetical protein FAIPA1_230069 [Frankia sp. AiPs1]